MDKLLIGIHGYWTKLTYFGVISAVVGMYFAFAQNIKYAVISLIVSGICDMFDGPVARTAKRTEREKNYGIQIDSLADIINFGMLPVVIAYVLCSDFMFKNYGNLGTIVNIIVISLYLLAALIRLAYFNVIEIELSNKDVSRTYYEGLPVTTVAIIVPIIYSVCLLFNIAFAPVYTVMMFVLSIMFVLKIKIPKLRGFYLITVCLPGLPAVIYVFLTKGISL